MRRVFDEHAALALATTAAAEAPCAKSKRGVVLFCRTHGLLGVGCNHPPDGFACDDSRACRANCNKICVHAEMDAFAEFQRQLRDNLVKRHPQRDIRPEMLHVKVVDGNAVPSGEPSCWQCSRHVINFGVQAFWLLHEGADRKPYLQKYNPDEFHEHTLRWCQLPVIR